MKNRRMRLRMLAGGLAAMLIMSNMSAITSRACELDEGCGMQEVIEATEYVSGYDDHEEPESVIEVGSDPEVAEATETGEVTEVAEEEENQEESEIVIEAGSDPEVAEAVESDEAAEVEEAVESDEVTEVAEEEKNQEEPEKVIEVGSDPVIAEAEETDEVTKTDKVDEIVVPVHEHSADVVRTDIKTIRLTESKEKRIITEFTDKGWRIVTTQYIQDGEVVKQSVYDQVAERSEMADESWQWTLEMQEAERLYKEEQARILQAQSDAEKADLIIEDTLNALTLDEFLDVYYQMSSGNDSVFVKQLVEEINANTSDGYNKTEEDIKKVVKSVYKNLLSGAIKQLPGSDFYMNSVTGILNGALDLEDEKVNLQEIIENGNKELKKELMNGFDKTERNIDNYGTLKEYAEKLDEFTDYANMRRDGIKEFNKNYNELESKVMIANLIGSSSEWFTGANNGNIMKSLTSAAGVFKGETNVDTRDIFNIIYDINKESSLFSGEAMSKSQEKIEKAVSGFVCNCQVIMECLKAHDEIADFTEEQIASLDDQTRAIYDQIHAKHETIDTMRRKLAAIFLGDKSSNKEEERFGLLDKANQYYSKDKTTYIDYGNNGDGIKLKDTLKETRGRDYIKADQYTDLQKIDSTIKASGLKPEDIDKIAYQAQSHGMTIKEYLESCGFNVDNLRGYNYLMADSYYYQGESLLGFRAEDDHEGIMAYDVKDKNVIASKEKNPLTLIFVGTLFGGECKREVTGNWNQNVCFVTFEAEK